MMLVEIRGLPVQIDPISLESEIPSTGQFDSDDFFQTPAKGVWGFKGMLNQILAFLGNPADGILFQQQLKTFDTRKITYNEQKCLDSVAV